MSHHTPSPTEPYKILFVCLGNICRSPAAQAVMQRVIDERGLTRSFFLDSAGTYGGHAGDMPDRRMRVHARERGYNLTHRSRRITPDDFNTFHLIVAMDHANVTTLHDMIANTTQESKIVMMGRFIHPTWHHDYVPDPYYEGSEGFELVLDLLEDSCRTLLTAILNHEV